MNKIERDPKKTSRSTGGPRTPEGKANSSKNSFKHGCRSHVVILPGEHQQDFDDLYNRWNDAYQPDSSAAAELLEQLVLNKWFLLRNERRYSEIELHLAPFPFVSWTPEQHREYQLTLRYKALRELEDYLKNRRTEDTHRALSKKESFKSYRDLSRGMRESEDSYSKQIADAQALGLDMSQQNAALIDTKAKNRATLDGLRARLLALDQDKVLKEIPSPAHTSPKKFRITPFVEQCATINIDNGAAAITLHPPNQQLISDASRMDPNPDIVYRRLEFPRGVPAEYPWVTTDPFARQHGGFIVQRIPFVDWLQLIELENGDPNGPLHSSPNC